MMSMTRFAIAVLLIISLSAPVLAISQYNFTTGSDTVEVFNGTSGSLAFTVPTGVTSIWMLGVAGGGGGGRSIGGGGGAGGLVNGTWAVTPGETLIITVGNQGLGGLVDKGTNGTNSSVVGSYTFFSAKGGGGGGSISGSSGLAGGSGGGSYGTGTPGGSNVTGQGFAGGVGHNTAGGGGGGATNTGGAGASGLAGNGGFGFATAIKGYTDCMAGGGAGGADAGTNGTAQCGGGYGTKNTGPVGGNAAPNSGGGGGGGGYTYNGGNGANGTVILRYSAAPALTASFTQNATEGFPITAVSFTDTSTGTPTAWNWSIYYTGSSPVTPQYTTQNAVHVFSTGGNFTVNLTVIKPGATSTAIGYVDIWNYTSGDFSANVTSGIFNLPVGFTATTFNATSWNWSFGDGNVSSLQNPSHVYTGIGTYDVKLRINNTKHFTWINKTGYITTSDSLYYINANFTPLLTVGFRPTTVSFTDISTYFNSSPATWNWSMGDGFIDTNQSPTHTFNSAGNFRINLTASNTTLGISSTKLGWVNLTNASGFNQQDIVMTPSYTVRLRFTDSTTSAPVAGAVVVLGSASNTTDTSGYVTFPSVAYSLVSFSASASGYYGTTGSFVVDSNQDRSYQMVPTSNAVPNTNTVYTQHFISFRVVDLYNRPLHPVTVTAYYVNSSLPSGSNIDYLTKAFGIDSVIAASMLNSSVALQGTTGTDGKIGFVMFPAIQYTVQAVNTSMGAACQLTAYPTDSDYLMYCPLQGQSLQYNNTATQIAGSYVWITEPNNSYVTFNAQYQDPYGITTDLWFNVTCPDNQTTLFSNNPGNPGTSVYRANFTLPNVRGTQVNAYLKYNRSA